MDDHLTLPMFGLIALCVAAEAAREICFRQAAQNAAFTAALARPLTWLGITFWALELVAWTVVLEHVALSIAFPLMSLSYVTIVAACALILKEQVSFRHAVGALLITAGVACVGATGI